MAEIHLVCLENKQDYKMWQVAEEVAVGGLQAALGSQTIYGVSLEEHHGRAVRSLLQPSEGPLFLKYQVYVAGQLGGLNLLC